MTVGVLILPRCGSVGLYHAPETSLYKPDNIVGFAGFAIMRLKHKGTVPVSPTLTI